MNTELSLFTGAGGGVYASTLLGHKIVGYVEQNEYCQEIIKQRIADGVFNDAPIFGDIREFDGTRYENSVDIISGGFPCQPFSVAGRKKGKHDTRNMWPDTIRIIKQIKPKEAFLENVPGLLSSGYFGTILNDLSKAGYDARWITLSASDCGAPHKRERLWILADSRCERRKEGADENLRSKSEESIGQNASKLCESVPDSHVSDVEGSWKPSRTQEAYAKFKQSSWWQTEPDICRVANGMANRKHRLTALGNGQVPIVAARAYLILKETK